MQKQIKKDPICFLEIFNFNFTQFYAKFQHVIKYFYVLVDAIYDLTVGIKSNDGHKPDLNTIRNGIPLQAEIYVKRVSFSDVPQDEEGSANFLHKLYQEKVKKLVAKPIKSTFFNLFLF